MLLELVVDAPAGGDRIDVLCALLELARDDVEVAVAALAAVGFACRRGGEVVYASEAARRIEHLWPTGL